MRGETRGAGASVRSSCRARLGALVGVAAALAPLALPAPAACQTLLTQEEALELAFPAPTRVERRTAYLTDAQLVRARELAGDGVEIDQGVVTYYVGVRDGTPSAAAYFEAHRVRTKNEVVMVVVDPDGRVLRVDVLKFTEPPEYRAPPGWIQQLEGRALEDDLTLRGGVHNLTGATLTARALTEATRRVLALHRVIQPLGSAP